MKFHMLAPGLLLFGFTSQLPAQSFVQISTIQARPEALTCVGPGATAIVRLQVYLAGIPEAAKSRTATAQLAVYSARPSINKIAIRGDSKDFPLSDSPALVNFEVNCSSDTLPGEITLAAVISAAPEGVLVKEPVVQPLVRIRIERP